MLRPPSGGESHSGDLRLPLDAHVLQSVCLAVPASRGGQSREQAGSPGVISHDRTRSKERERVAVQQDPTCSQRRAPLRSGWPSWQRSQCGGRRSPSSLQSRAAAEFHLGEGHNSLSTNWVREEEVTSYLLHSSWG